ncbi:hypothetical protein P7K49_026033 [Saguinus oedipus]|uniref:Uncharacterized protein n=1 Tax=Saguinus oedipus TaxID=9490 RepID=A0ABQ9UJP5_SAGOE|nr:hypothetical protein P7K49_026033 [Saguinus oedipus]
MCPWTRRPVEGQLPLQQPGVGGDACKFSWCALEEALQKEAWSRQGEGLAANMQHRSSRPGPAVRVQPSAHRLTAPSTHLSQSPPREGFHISQMPPVPVPCSPQELPLPRL